MRRKANTAKITKIIIGKMIRIGPATVTRGDDGSAWVEKKSPRRRKKSKNPWQMTGSQMACMYDLKVMALSMTAELILDEIQRARGLAKIRGRWHLY